MAEYILNKAIGNDTNIKLETNDRCIFYKLEEMITKFITELTKESESNNISENENDSDYEIEKFIPFTNENPFKIIDRNENESEELKKNETVEMTDEKNETIKSKSKKKERLTFKELQKQYPKLKTKFGMAYVNPNSLYYTITSTKEGNRNKLLHRLIFEDFYGIEIPKGYVIHHKNGDKYDNCILNLQMLPEREHLYCHDGMYTNELKGVRRSLDECIAVSKAQNKSGYFRVTKRKCKGCKSGFHYIYQYYDENQIKRGITATTINRLKRKVEAKGLPWKKL